MLLTLEGCVMQVSSGGFLESVDQNFRRVMSFLDLPEGIMKPADSCSSLAPLSRMGGVWTALTCLRSAHSSLSRQHLQNEAPRSGLAKLGTCRGMGIAMCIGALRPEQRR